MTRINKRYFNEFTFSNLDDCEVSSPSHNHIPVFDQGTNKWTNARSDSFLNLNKSEYTSSVVIEENTNAIMLRPQFLASLEIEANATLELFG